MLTVDDKRGIAYLPFGAPTFDRYGGDHKGANLFSNSAWWRWTPTPANISGTSRPCITTSGTMDLHTPPVLLDVKKDGKTIPAVAAMNKTALLFILEPRHRRADLRRHRKAGAALAGRQREGLADPARSRQARATGAHAASTCSEVANSDAGASRRLPGD